MKMQSPFVLHAGRIRSVDVIRGVALVFMILNHFGQIFVGGGFHSPLALSILFMGIFPAPLFYTVVGISIALVNQRYNTKSLPPYEIWRRTLPRAILILGLGYLFAVVMFGRNWIFDWSVLQLIGLALIVCQLAMRIPWKYRVLLPVVFVVAAPGLRLLLNYEAIVGTIGNLHYQPPLTILDHLSAMLATGKVPIFPWMACPLMGTIIGEAYAKVPSNPRQLVTITGIAGGVMCLSVVPLMVFAGDFVTQYPLTTGFFQLSAGLSLIVIAIVVLTVDLWRWWNFASRFIEIQGLTSLFTYIAHHFYGPFFLGQILGLYHALDMIGLILIILSYFLIATVFALVWLPYRQGRSSYWDIAIAYILLLAGLIFRAFLVMQGVWSV
jgi:uncharacterized membrane protein